MANRDLETTVGKVGRVSSAYFVEHVLPLLPEELDVDAVMKAMERASRGKASLRRVPPFAKNGHWRGFAMMSPADGDRKKDKAFKNFPAVIDAIRRTAVSKMQGVEPVSKFVQNTNVAEDPALHPADTLPDACIVPRDSNSSTPVALSMVNAMGWYERYDTSMARKAVRPHVLNNETYCDIRLLCLTSELRSDAYHVEPLHEGPTPPLRIWIHDSQRVHGTLVH